MGRTTFATVVTIVGHVSLVGCGSSPNAPAAAVAPPLVAATDVPLSESQSVALVRGDTACVVESYEFRIHCVARSGRVVGVFGREGEGPGEFSSLVMVARGPDGDVALVDMVLSRLTLFRLDGAVLSQTQLPGGFLAVQIAHDRIVGSVLDASAGKDQGEDRPILPPAIPMEVDVQTGRVLWSRQGMTDAARTDCLMLAEIGISPAGGLVARDCSRRGLVFFEDKDGEGTVVSSPIYSEELPNERDVDAYLAGMARLWGGSGQASRAWRDGWASEFRNTPKAWYRGPLRFDGEGRTWIAISLDRDRRSYFEIWADAEYVGSVRIRDRVIGYDILDATLVALVERNPDRNGVSQRAIDWYDIAGLEFGSGGR